MPIPVQQRIVEPHFVALECDAADEDRAYHVHDVPVDASLPTLPQLLHRDSSQYRDSHLCACAEQLAVCFRLDAEVGLVDLLEASSGVYHLLDVESVFLYL